jgi:hypothetical protein
MGLFRFIKSPADDSTDNTGMNDVIGSKADAQVNAVGTTVSLLAYAKGILAMQEQCVEKSDGAALANTIDNLFTITGGPIFVTHLFGIVTTVIVGTANGKLQIVTTTPSATVDISAAAVAIDNDAAGTSYYSVGATGVFTPVTAGYVKLDPVTVEPTQFFCPIGTIGFHSSAACTGVIKWYLRYKPMSPSSRVVAAA